MRLVREKLRVSMYQKGQDVLMRPVHFAYLTSKYNFLGEIKTTIPTGHRWLLPAMHPDGASVECAMDGITFDRPEGLGTSQVLS